ncbi:MAG: DUF6056 family protein [Lachnospiraceae bacterium]
MKNKRKTIYTYLPVIVFFCYACLVFRKIGYLPGDDEFYRNTFANQSVLQWCKDFYLQWSGRVPLQLLDILFLNLPLMVWKIVNALFYALIPFYFCRISRIFLNDKGTWGFFLGVCACVMLVEIPDAIMASAVYWVTGSFNYLWPTVGLLVGIYPLLAAACQKQCRKIDFFVGIIGTFFACYAEQTAAVYLCLGGFCVVTALVKKHEYRFVLTTLYLFGGINALIQFAAPGNHVRSEAELLRWYPNFDMHSTMDRLWLGGIHTMKEVLVEGYPFFLCMLLLLGIVVAKKGFFLQICYGGVVVLTGIAWKISNGLEDGAIWQIYNTKLLLCLGVLVFWMFFSAWFVFCALDLSFQGFIGALLFLAAFASGIVVGMSPTIYASDVRIYFLSYILIILFLLFLLGYVLKEEEKTEKA